MLKYWVQVNLRVAVMVLFITTLMASLLPMATSASNQNTLKVSPVRTDIEIQPGGSKTVQTTVSNLTNEPLTLRPVNNDFISGDESGTPALILDENEFAPTHSLKRFMQPIQNFTVPAGESKTVEVVISVPQDVQAGGYFGAVRFEPVSPEGGGQVNMSASAASIILLTVPGDMVERLVLSEFNIQQNGKTNTIFHSADNIEAAFRFENKGNAQVGPFGKISVTKGNDIVYEYDFNPNSPRDMILPDSARRWGAPLTNLGSFGRYTVNGTLTYGQQNKTIEVNQSFWIIPWNVIIGAGVLLLVITGLIIGLIFYIKNRQQRTSRRFGSSGGLRL